MSYIHETAEPVFWHFSAAVTQVSSLGWKAAEGQRRSFFFGGGGRDH